MFFTSSFLKMRLQLSHLKMVLFILLIIATLRFLFFNKEEYNIIQEDYEFESEFGQIEYSSWKFETPRFYSRDSLHQWSEPYRPVNTQDLLARGENGTGFFPTKDEEDLAKKLRKEHNYNLLASNLISLRRSLPDHRFPECQKLFYPEKLPTTSVVIIFHNEAWSNLMRTVWSIIDRSPPELIEEIILVDDFSTWESLKRPLDDYVKKLPVRIRTIRTKKREGLKRARLIGARNATGSVLTFLDAHMECTEGWLQPILSRIANDRSVVAIPYLDFIDIDNYAYIPAEPNMFSTVGLRWNLLFYWTGIPKRELLRTNYDRTAPIRTPSHVGCAFSMDRKFFFEIGSYDEGMDIWGSENVELAFRVWMCGGSLEVIPCSHVGHLYRTSTYSFDGDGEIIKIRNNVRVVEVWMDEYKKFFYAAEPTAKNILPGNITTRLNIKQRLKCNSFHWYLENVFPEGNFFKQYHTYKGLINVAENKCMDGPDHADLQIGLDECNENKIKRQFFAFTKTGEIISHLVENCVGIKDFKVVIVLCSNEDKAQRWKFNYKKKWIVHQETGLCIRNNQFDLIVATCSSRDARFKWKLIK